MFAQNPFNSTNVNSLLSSQNRVFGAVNYPNTISTFFSKGGAYANQQKYVVKYSSPTGGLQSRVTNSIHQAVSDARSGQRSNRKDFKFVSYWSKDAYLAMSLYGAPAGLATDGGTPVEPRNLPMPLPAPLPDGGTPEPLPAPSPTPPPIDTPVEDNTDTETGDPSDDPNAQEESGGDISTLSDTTELVETEKEVRPAFVLLPIIAIAGIGYFTYTESKKK